MARVIDAFSQFFDGAGDPLINGFLRFTVSGTNNTDKNTFADVSETIANANPVPLDGEGRCPNVFGPGSYRVRSFADSVITPGTPGQQIELFDPVGGTFGTGPLDDWNADSIYSITDEVKASDNLYYRSLINNNVGNDPVTDAVNWEKIEFVYFYNANRTYLVDDKVRIANGIEFVSLTGSNLNNEPSVSSANWKALDIRDWSAPQEFGLNETARASDGVLYVSLVATNSGNDPLTSPASWGPSSALKPTASSSISLYSFDNFFGL